MPNHCESRLFVNGAANLVKEIVSKYFTENGELNCDSVIPYPLNFKQLDEVAAKWVEDNKDKEKINWSEQPTDGYNSGGYEWCVANWGTKWPTYDGCGMWFSKCGESVRISFQSAWNPPTPVVAKLAEMYPAVRFEMSSREDGMEEQDHNVWVGGALVDESESNYKGSRGG